MPAPAPASPQAAPRAAQTVRRIPLDRIDPHALRRDRVHIDEPAMEELTGSIRGGGLRMPVELFPLPKRGRYGLISGFRRLQAFRRLLDETGEPAFAAIPAMVREVTEGRALLAAMIEENEVRAPLSPWEQEAALLSAVEQGFYDCLEDAAKGLHPHASRRKQGRLLKIARAVEALGPKMKQPHTLSLRKCLRLADAVEAGFGEVIGVALDGCRVPLPDVRWSRIEPYLRESEALPPDRKPIRRHPIRVMEMKPGIMLRREKTQDGWAIHMHGKRMTEADVEQAFLTIQIIFGMG